MLQASSLVALAVRSGSKRDESHGFRGSGLAIVSGQRLFAYLKSCLKSGENQAGSHSANSTVVSVLHVWSGMSSALNKLIHACSVPGIGLASHAIDSAHVSGI